MPSINPSDDIVGFSNELFNKQLDPSRIILERIWERNIMYLLGEQWIDGFDMNRHVFTSRRRMFNEPTPVDNIIRDYVRAMVALILGKDYKVRIWPNSNELPDKDAASVGECFLRHMEMENDEEFADEIELVALWAIIAGTSFCRTFPSVDRGQVYAFENGKIVKDAEVVNQHILPFCVVMDDIGANLTQKRWVGIETIKPKSWVKDNFGVEVSDADAETGHINYQKKLMKMVGSISPWKGAGIEPQSYDRPSEDLCLFREIEFRPCKDYPNGRYVCLVGSSKEPVYDKEQMVIPKEGKNWYYSITDFHYYLVPGRFWSDPGVNDQITHQNIINRIDQALIKNRDGIGKPMLLTTPDIIIKRVNEAGTSLTQIEYDPLLSGGQKPEINHGVPLPAQVLEERAIHIEAAQQSAGDPKGVLRGRSPSAQASGVMVDILKEAAESSHSPDIQRFYRSKARVYKKTLILGKNLYTRERIIKVYGSGTDVKVMNFKGADLNNNTDVRLEMASGISTTNAGKTELMFKAADSGWFGDLQNDPETRQEFLRQLGLSGFKHKYNTDIDRALLEMNTLLSTTKKEVKELRVEIPIPRDPDEILPYGTEVKNPEVVFSYVEGVHLAVPDPRAEVDPQFEGLLTIFDDPLFEFDNHQIHYEIHRRFILSDEFRALTPELKDVAMAHTKLHREYAAEEAAQEQQAMMEQQAEMEGKPIESPMEGEDLPI